MKAIQMPKNPCAICRKREVVSLCDFVVGYYWLSHHGGMHETCDMPLCKECATNQGPFDFCPIHKKMLPDLKIEDQKLKTRIHRHQGQMLMEHEKERNE